MKIVIIEDERLTAEDLAGTISEVDVNAEIVASLESVREAITYFKENDTPDLIFSDIQLSDGLSFELFKALPITVPVIFCTAYDEYAIQAFKANGIDYIMKPFTRKTIADALTRYQKLKNNFSQAPVSYETMLELFENRGNLKQASILVYYKDQIMPVKIKDIALFYIENETTRLLTFKGQSYLIDNNLEELGQLTGNEFFRASRQYLVNRNAIKSASPYFGRKLAVRLSVPHQKSIIVSKAKATAFLHWLSR